MEQTGNLTIEIRKSSLGQQCFNSATVTLIPSSFGGRRMKVESSASSMSLQAKFKDVPLGWYDVHVSCKGYVSEVGNVHVKATGGDSSWNGHFARSPNVFEMAIVPLSGVLLMANDRVNPKATLPFANQFLANAILHGGDLYFGASSDMARAIVNSEEFKDRIGEFKGKALEKHLKETLLFTKNRDLARSIHDAHFNYDIKTDGVTYKLKGVIEDEYDFRFSTTPKTDTFGGHTLRWVGNGAYIGQTLYVLGNFKARVEIEAQGTL